MILVLKINGFLRSIDKRIGNPLNNISIMVKLEFSIKIFIKNRWNLFMML